jgi:large subunit ribosomal protein L29
MNIEDARALSSEEIAREIENRHEEWRNLRFQNALGRLTTFHQLRDVRKSIAQLKTVLREREIQADPVGHYSSNDRKRARNRTTDKAARRARTQRARHRDRLRWR